MPKSILNLSHISSLKPSSLHQFIDFEPVSHWRHWGPGSWVRNHCLNKLGPNWDEWTLETAERAAQRCRSEHLKEWTEQNDGPDPIWVVVSTPVVSCYGKVTHMPTHQPAIDVKSFFVRSLHLNSGLCRGGYCLRQSTSKRAPVLLTTIDLCPTYWFNISKTQQKRTPTWC